MSGKKNNKQGVSTFVRVMCIILAVLIVGSTLASLIL